MRVLVCDGLAERGLAILRAAPGLVVDARAAIKPDELAAALPGCAALIVRSATKVTADVLARAPDLRVVGRAGIGVDNIDVQAASRRGVVVMNTPRGNAVTTAEHALSLLLSLARRIPQATASMKAGRWEKKKFEGVELCDKSLGVIGLGNIGRIVADRALGLKMKVLAYDPFLSAQSAAALGVELAPLADVLARADFLTLHTPLTAETRNLIDAAALARTKKGVLIVNAARGGLIDETALHDALRAGHVGGAALDVFATEPPGAHPLLALDNVIATPHLGASTEEAQEKVSVEIAEQVVAFLLRGEVRNAVNLPPLAPELRERVEPWLDLASRLGAFASQLGGAGLDEVEVETVGEVAELAAKPAAAAALAGLLAGFVDVPVNRVNAPLLAAERGVRVTEIQRDAGRVWRHAIGLRLRGGAWERRVVGTVLRLGDEPEPRIVQVDAFHVEAVPQGTILVVRNEDRPGVIGAVGTLLGKAGINVSRAQVGLSRASREAVELWNVDSPLPEPLLAEVRKVPGVLSATQVRL